MHIGFDLGQYYEHLHLRRDVIFLYANRFLIQIASGMLTVFTAVFFYEQFDNSYTLVAILFALIYGIYVLMLPLSVRLINYFSLKKLLISSVFFLPLTILALLLWESNPALSVSLYIGLGLMYRLLYWTPYYIDFAKFTDKRNRGKQMSFLENISEIAFSFPPLFSGIIIAAFGFNVVFIIAAIFTSLSIIPLFFISDVVEKYSFTYAGTFKELFQKENRSLLLGYAGDGMQSGVRIIIWPIFIFTLLSGEYVAIGLVTSVTILILIVVRFILGNLVDRWDRKKLLIIGVFFATTGWFFKVFIDTGFQILVADTYHRMGNAINRLSTDVVMYDHAADNGHYIDEYTVLREMSINGGRAVMLLISIWFVSLYGISSMFILAAGATLLMMLLNKSVQIE